jgi:hypothetical protein
MTLDKWIHRDIQLQTFTCNGLAEGHHLYTHSTGLTIQKMLDGLGFRV